MVYQISEGVTAIHRGRYKKRDFTKALNRLRYSVQYRLESDGVHLVYVEPYEKRYKNTDETRCEEEILRYIVLEDDYVYVQSAILICCYVEKKNRVATVKIETRYPDKFQALFQAMDAIRKIRVKRDVKRIQKNSRNS